MVGTRKRTAAAPRSLSPKIKEERDDQENVTQVGKRGRPAAKAEATQKKMSKSTRTNIPQVSSVDIFVPNSHSYRVLSDDSGNPYTAMLNQTNLTQNNNKFFLIQALEIGGKFATWFRWGRVGYSGQTNLQQCESRDEAISIFTRKFSDKTCNEWCGTIHRKFKTHSGKYTLLPVESLTQSAEDNAGKPAEITTVKYADSRLDKSIYDLICLISSRETFERELQIAGIDLTRMPLGKISDKMIKDAYKVLDEIEAILLSKTTPSSRRSSLIELSSKFYTIIPHNFGFSKGINYVIDSITVLREKVDLIETLGQIKESNDDISRIVKKEEIVRENPIDEKYNILKYGLRVVDPKSREFAMIDEYRESTHGPTHSCFAKLLNVFSLDSGSPDKKKNRTLGSTHLLWHGSRLTNWFSILTHGLKIAPPEAPHTGYMFDKGIYTADCFSKSANYCFSSPGQRGLLVLCEVDLGKSKEAMEADYSISEKLGNEFHSTKGVGRFVPASFAKTEDGVLIPSGGLVDRVSGDRLGSLDSGGRKSSRFIPPATAANGSLLYNEYIVYKTDQVRMKYLVEVEFTRTKDA